MLKLWIENKITQANVDQNNVKFIFSLLVHHTVHTESVGTADFYATETGRFRQAKFIQNTSACILTK